jgi:hypothetical protein
MCPIGVGHQVIAANGNDLCVGDSVLLIIAQGESALQTKNRCGQSPEQLENRLLVVRNGAMADHVGQEVGVCVRGHRGQQSRYPKSQRVSSDASLMEGNSDGMP